MARSRLEYAWRSNRGLVRARNEDSVAVFPHAHLLVVADGIGGARAGDVASRIATETISRRFLRRLPSRVDSRHARILAEAAVGEANGSILEHAEHDSDCIGMGTTVVVGYAGNAWLVYAHVGDSRLYRLRNQCLEQLTRDHSFIQEAVNQGLFADLDEARGSGVNHSLLTRALGSASAVTVATAETELAAGDIYLFCTDGLSGMVPDQDLRWALSSVAAGQVGLGTAADALVDLACENGGLDNITLALVRVNAVGDSDRLQVMPLSR